MTEKMDKFTKLPLENKYKLEKKIEERTAELNMEINKRRKQQEAMLNIMEDLDASNKILKKEVSERRRAEAKIKHRLKFERLIAVSSARLAVSGDVKQAVYKALRDMGNFIGADRAYIFTLEKNDRKLRKFSSWLTDDNRVETGNLTDLPASVFGDWLKKIREGRIIKIKKLTRTSSAGGIGGKILKSQNIKSILLFPLDIREKTTALLGFDNVIEEASWHTDDIPLLRIFSNILSKAMEQNELKEEREKYEFIINTSLEMQTLINRKYIYEAANTAFCNAMKRERRDVLGKSVSDIWGKDIFDEVIKNHLDRCFEGEIVNYQDSFVLPGKASLFYDINMYPYADSTGDVNRAVVITHDISDLKKMEQHLMRQSRLASIGKLAAGVAHELNNPLTAVITFLDLTAASARDRLKKEEAENLSKAKSSALRMKKIIRDLLAFSRFKHEEKKSDNINEIIKSAVKLGNPGMESITLKEELKKVPDFPINREHMVSLFLNLLSNSIDAMEKSRKKNIIISSEFLSESGLIRICFADSGQGIKPDIADKIFDPFFTLKETGKGTGLGLSIVHGIVKEHGGKVEVNTSVMEGTEFVLTFPVKSINEIYAR